MVAPRLPGKENPKLKTGAIEVRADALEVLNASPTPPFEIQGAEANEELRLKYRYPRPPPARRCRRCSSSATGWRS